MTLCLPFLMFQGRAQEAIDHYLETFPDAELLEIQHHLEGTEIFDPAAEHAAEADGAEDSVQEDAEEAESSGDPEDPEDQDSAKDTDEDTEDSEETDESGGSGEFGGSGETGEADQPEETEASAEEEPAEAPEDSAPGDSAPENSVPQDSEPQDSEPESSEPVGTEELPILVATAQLRIGGQVLMLQDSLVKHEFSFTPSASVAVVVDSGAEFDQIVGKLAEGGHYLMEPGDYDFAKNFAWVTDRFGVSWQVNHPLGAPDENIAQAKAPEWG